VLHGGLVSSALSAREVASMKWGSPRKQASFRRGTPHNEDEGDMV
jgi:hypothetical protein